MSTGIYRIQHDGRWIEVYASGNNILDVDGEWLELWHNGQRIWCHKVPGPKAYTWDEAVNTASEYCLITLGDLALLSRQTLGKLKAERLLSH